MKKTDTITTKTEKPANRIPQHEIDSLAKESPTTCNHQDQEPESKSEKGIAAKMPQFEIDALARAFLPAILEFYRSEEGQREFADWKANRDKQKLNK